MRGYAVLQLLLAPLLLWRSVVAALLSNALYAAALGYYHYLSFLGYSALPFLEHTEARRDSLLHAWPATSACLSAARATGSLGTEAVL